MVFGDILTMFFSLLSVLVGFMYPAYSSYKAVEAKNPEAQARWLVYWAVFGLFSVTEVVLDVFLGRVTIYYIGKLSFLIWLQLPQTRVRTTNTYSAPIHTLKKKKKKKISMHAAALSMKSHTTTFPVDTLTCRHSRRWAYTEMIARSCSYRCRLRTLLTKKRLLNMYMILHVCVCVCPLAELGHMRRPLICVCVCVFANVLHRAQASCMWHTYNHWSRNTKSKLTTQSSSVKRATKHRW